MTEIARISAAGAQHGSPSAWPDAGVSVRVPCGSAPHLIDNGIDRIDWVDRNGCVIDINAVGRRTLGLTAAQGAGLDWLTLWSSDQQAVAADHLDHCHAGVAGRFTAASGPDNDRVWWDVVISQRPDQTILVQARDITRARAIEDGFRQRTRHDDLTGLLNRSAFKDALSQTIAEHAMTGRSGMVLMLDLDNFKFINDTMGHDTGDRVLQSVAKALLAVVGPEDRLARLGGDEFAVLLPTVGDSDTLRARAEAINARLRQPVEIEGRSLLTRASIGAVQFPKHGSVAVDLLKNADIALYAAKSFGRGGYVQFVPAMAGPMRRRAAAIAAVRSAIADDRVDAFYQPVIDLASGQLHGFEASLHVFEASGRVLSAAELALVQDDIDLAEQLGNRLLKRLTDDARQWHTSGLALTRIAVNVAAAEFRSGNYADRFLAQLSVAGLPPALFDIEVAETVLTGRGTDYVAAALKTLSAAGVGVSLDAFGTGPASLSNLKRLPVNAIKIDQSFVEGVENDPADGAIVRAIIGIASGFGIALGAEGVSTQGQARMLRALGCDTGQGGLFGEAGAFETTLPLLRDRQPVAAVAAHIAVNCHLAEEGQES